MTHTPVIRKVRPVLLAKASKDRQYGEVSEWLQQRSLTTPQAGSSATTPLSMI
ncbi:hypothetical protein [Ferrimonas sp.]|uniref:hypothetical protein n=1 Tax=Ferrimonas sp. TaxID=2080861 RepID=UPI003A947DFF